MPLRCKRNFGAILCEFMAGRAGRRDGSAGVRRSGAGDRETGHGEAAVHLLKRRYALQGIKQYSAACVAARVALMNAARQAKRLRRQ